MSRKIIYGLFGALIGLCIGSFLKNFRTIEIVSMCTNSMAAVQMKSPSDIINLQSHETPNNSQRNLMFVGVMTSKDFLRSRAKAVYNTWGKNITGRIAFFSSEGSISSELPVIALKGVDDRYPPQKKSFMMLHYMYEHFIDKFEWFARADDDVYIKTDKLEKFLRSVDSSKAQFIGQAGRGNNEEFGLLSLEFDENFCMGGPGIIMSRETLRRVAPHIPTCLKNLYSTHEDVEVGRCVQKFAGIPCTWNYEMQSILHHNSSGHRAFSGNLKNKEVHSAITLHPIKRAPLMYRIHAYNLGLKAQELRQEALHLHRDIAQMIHLLQIPKTYKMLAKGVPLFPENDVDSLYFLDDHSILGNNPDLNRHLPSSKDDVIEWDFLAKSIYSSIHANPKRKMESSFREGLEDVIREIMENINNFSRQRGRIIEFRELLYGYSRVNAMYGQDLILDLLLVYKKYRGKKMTVPVRRHLYIQRSFTEIRIREDLGVPLGVSGLAQPNTTYNRISDKMKSLFNDNLDTLNKLYTMSGFGQPTRTKKTDDKIVFVLPLSGRHEIFLRFLNNFEDVIMKTGENVNLIVSLFVENHDPHVDSIISTVDHLHRKYKSSSNSQIHVLKLFGNFSRGIAIDSAIHSHYIRDEDIIFLIDVDIYFNSTTLTRIRKNTIKNQQVYLPIVFSEYNPDILHDSHHVPFSSPAFNTSLNSTLSSLPRISNYLLEYNNMFASYQAYNSLHVDDTNGYFREFGYGLVAIYKCDIMNSKVNGFVTHIKNWGLEDVLFLEKVIQTSHQQQNQVLLNIADGKAEADEAPSVNLNIFRAADPSLVHIYHPIICDKSLDEAQYKMCQGTMANTLGNYKLLKKKYCQQQDFFQFLKKARRADNEIRGL